MTECSPRDWADGMDARAGFVSQVLQAYYRVPQSLIHYHYRGRDASLTNALAGFQRPFFSS